MHTENEEEYKPESPNTTFIYDTISRVLISPYPDQEVKTSSEACQGRARFQQHRDARYHQVSFPARQDAEGNSRNSDGNIGLFHSWPG